MKRAQVDRAELFDASDTLKQSTTYDLGASGITWRCLRKDYGPEIQQATGHEKYDTTDGYISTARVFVGRVGDPFPPLPPTLLRADFRSHFRSHDAQPFGMIASPTGFETLLNSRNPAKLALTAGALVA